MSQAEIVQIEESVKELKQDVDMAAALERLLKNRDFKKVVDQAYFKDEAVRLVHLKSDSNMRDPFMQEKILRDIDAIGSLRQFFDLVMYKGYEAQVSIEEYEEARIELENEGSDA